MEGDWYEVETCNREENCTSSIQQAPYTVIFSKAIEKCKEYQSQLYIEEEEYMLVYEDGKQAQFLPGTVEFFSLLRYHEEIGKDYKRIVLYLCTTTDIRAAERSRQEVYSSESENSEDESQFRPGNKAKSEIDRDEELPKKPSVKIWSGSRPVWCYNSWWGEMCTNSYQTWLW